MAERLAAMPDSLTMAEAVTQAIGHALAIVADELDGGGEEPPEPEPLHRVK